MASERRKYSYSSHCGLVGILAIKIIHFKTNGRMLLKEIVCISMKRINLFFKSAFAIFVFLNVVTAYSQSEATLQAEQWFKKTDKKMKQSYDKVLRAIKHSSLEEDIKKIVVRDFISSQKAWIEYREKEATFEAGLTSDGGSAFTMDYLGNLAELNEERTKQFSKFIKKLK